MRIWVRFKGRIKKFLKLKFKITKMRLKNANIQLQKPTVYYTSQNPRKPKKAINIWFLHFSLIGQKKKNPRKSWPTKKGAIVGIADTCDRPWPRTFSPS
jgi:hypothetical protein